MSTNSPTPDLFPAAVSESPRAAWMRRHDLIVRDYHPFTHQHGNGRWFCSNRAMTRCAVADTQDAVEQRYCELFSITWWKLESWNGAMEKCTKEVISECVKIMCDDIRSQLPPPIECPDVLWTGSPNSNDWNI